MDHKPRRAGLSRHVKPPGGNLLLHIHGRSAESDVEAFYQPRKQTDDEIFAPPADSDSDSLTSVGHTTLALQRSSEQMDGLEKSNIQPSSFVSSKSGEGAVRGSKRARERQDFDDFGNSEEDMSLFETAPRKLLKEYRKNDRVAARGYGRRKVGENPSGRADKSKAAGATFKIPPSLEQLGFGEATLNEPTFKHPPSSKSLRTPRSHKSSTAAIAKPTSPTRWKSVQLPPIVCPSSTTNADHESSSAATILSTPSTPLSSPAHSGSRSPSPPPIVSCPICLAPVPRTTLSAFRAAHGLLTHFKVRHQRAFCRSHRQTAAHELWTARAYPTIAWPCLERRVERHLPALAAISRGTAPSALRDALRTQVRSGKGRSVAAAFATAGTASKPGGDAGAVNGAARIGDEDDSDEITPGMGYYGARGARVLGVAVMAGLGNVLRQVGPSDEAMRGGGGVGGFVQAVLVPELVLKLVAEDMGVDAAAARAIVAESREVGLLLCEEEDETVDVAEEEEEEEAEEGADDNEDDDKGSDGYDADGRDS